MPRQARLDAPGTLHPGMVRGLERRAIFREDTDRADFVARLAALAEAGALTGSAGALLPHHAHLRVRTGQRPLARGMRSLLTGYAGAFNRRHHRGGHLFQNRYQSIGVEEAPSLRELVRYLHLNPLRPQGVPDLRRVDRDPWAGHSALLGAVPRSGQETRTILAQFGPTPARAKRAYRAFVAEGIPGGRRPDLQGGGLVRSLGGWAAVRVVRRGREAYQGDERILGSRAFVERMHRTLAGGAARHPPRIAVDALVARVCRHVGIPPAHLGAGNRRPAASRAREGIAYLWTAVLGHPGRPLAPVLGIRPQNVYRAAAQGRAAAAEWERLLSRC